MLTLLSAIEKQNQTQSASTTYYVYAIGDGTNTSIHIDLSITPTLPSGYTLFRLIGNYITDADSKIEYIYNHNSDKPDTKAVIIDTYINGKSGYVIYSNKLCEQWGVASASPVTLLKPYADTNYNVVCQDNTNNPGTLSNAQCVTSLTTSQFTANLWNLPIFWRTIGYVA